MSNEIGKSLTFYELMSKEGHTIEIPIIQRDYAQGRENAKDIRSIFLRNIKSHLDEENPLNLDFVYGSIEGGRFIPIDGQQRLTTLFLLHWYLAWASDRVDDFKSYLTIQQGNSSKFTYETRVSSRDFCNALIKNHFERKNNDSIGKTIKNQHWYYLNWKHDATIKAMLNSLDTIEQIFDKPGEYYSKLVDLDHKLVTFQFIKLEDFGLSDHLYIKMNSRGKPLTPFENLKANIEQIYEDYDKKNGTDHTKWLTHNIDGKWTDLFWSYLQDKSRSVDQLFLNYIKASLGNYYALQDNCEESKLSELLSSGVSVDYFMLDQMGLANFEPLHDTFLRLDKLANDRGEFIPYITNKALLDSEALFRDVLNDSRTQTVRIMLFALTGYLVLGKDPIKIDAWIRVVRNLLENSRIETDNFSSAVKTLNSLLGDADNILNVLADMDNSELTGYSRHQSEEELLKAKLLTNNPEWANDIFEIENHPYLQGHIQFLLDFSGLTEEIKLVDFKALDSDRSAELLNVFRSYVEKFNLTFDSNGLRFIDQYQFERALLAIGDYTLPKSLNYSFLTNTVDREISWKRFFRESQVEHLKGLFDRIVPNDISGSLQKVIDEFDDKTDWRYYFVKYPEIIGETGSRKFIRYYDEDHILLLEKTQTNGYHAEYYSYAIKCDLERLGYDVGYHKDCYEGHGNQYIVRINDTMITICYYPIDEKGYWIQLDDGSDEFKLETHDEVIQYVEQNIPR